MLNTTCRCEWLYEACVVLKKADIIIEHVRDVNRVLQHVSKCHLQDGG